VGNRPRVIGYLWRGGGRPIPVIERRLQRWIESDQERIARLERREAIAMRRPQPGSIIHSARGYQFASHDWHDLAARHGLVVSLGERKSTLDNAPMESCPRASR
jgi:transposase InsO family protein